MRNLTLDEARRALFHAQGLAAPAAARGVGAPLVRTTVAQVLEQHGPVRTLGGIEGYLAVRARAPELGAADVHAAVARGEAQVMQAMRGCMYLVARAHAPLLRWLAASLALPRLQKEREKAGVRAGELERLGDQVLATLRAQGPLGTDGLKKALPKDAVRSLGDAGKKVGLSSTLPATLRLLEHQAKLTRRPEGDRLDNERYLWHPAPDARPLEGEPAALLRDVARVFARGAGLVDPDTFAGWAGVGLRDARAACGALGLPSVEVEGLGPRLAAMADVSVEMGAVTFLGFEDNLLAFQGSAAPFVDASHHGLEVPSWGSAGGGPLGAARHLFQRPVVVDGRVIGFWEFDPDARQVVWGCFDAPDAATRERLAARAADLSAWIAGEVGHGRSYSLDTDDALRERGAWVRTLGARRKRPAPARKKAPAKKKPRAKAKVRRTTA